MNRLTNFIGGEQVAPSTESYLPNHEPATGQIYSEVPRSGPKDIQNAIAAAKRAQPAWAALPARERSGWLRKLAQALESRLPEIARAESVDTGKPIQLATEVDLPRSVHNFEFFADAATQFSSECHITDDQAVNYTLREPVGVVACVSPWNLPLYLLTWKIAPALAAGNTVVAKPSEITPMTAALLGQLAAEAGLPPGVLNVVHGLGPELGPELVSHADVGAISFTGSTRTGAEIARQASPLFKKLSLEMGGKNATLVFADASFAETVRTVARSAFSNQGQVCLCGSRILVEKSIYEKFKEALIEKVRALRQGDPLERATEQGALVSQAHYEKVMGAIETARREGGRILTGGRRAMIPGRCERGWFVEPTLVEGLSPGCQTNQEEIFGPVATISSFESEAQALKDANSTRYGLSASVWTQDISRGHRVARRLQAGIVWINAWMLRDLRTPFGGVKDSGVGREGGWDALRFVTEPKNVCVKTS